jgi:hypothetical protein
MDATTRFQCSGPVNSYIVAGGLAIYTRRAGAAWAAWVAVPGVPAAARYLYLESSEVGAVASAVAKQR